MEKNQPKTAFVFSGGASLGALEVGMLKALVEEGYKADMVFGTSVGSLNGAFYAYNPSLEEVINLEQIWRKIKATDVFTPSLLTPIKNLATFGQYLVSPKNLRKLIVENIKFNRIEETQIPLFITATDINTGDEVVIDKGLIVEALLASAGIPGIFPPRRMGQRLLVDGGLVNNTPISSAVKFGAKKVVVFPIGFPYTPNIEPKNLEEILIRAFIYLLNRQLYADYHIYKNKVELIIIPPPENITVGPHDFSKSDRLIDRGYKYTKEWLSNGGYDDLSGKYVHPSDVHSDTLNLFEAIESLPEKPAKERVKENVSIISKDIKETLSKEKEELKTKYKGKKEKIKENIIETKGEIEKSFTETAKRIKNKYEDITKKKKKETN
ncbi:MAG: patatin-like phospholipase family protein [Promethearchaeota archaeon]